MQRKYFYRAIVLAVVPPVLGACGAATAAVEVPARTEVRATEFSFAPGDVLAKAGQPITIAFTNQGSVEHDWAVLDLLAYDVDVQMATDIPHPEGPHDHSMVLPDVHIAAMPGQSGDLVFTPERAGRYTIVCTVAGHREAGMTGTLTVVE